MSSVLTENKRENRLAEKYPAGFFAGILMVFLSILVISLYVFQKNRLDKKNNSKISSNKDLSLVTVSPKEEKFNCVDNIYQNKEIGYEICYPKGWVFKEFGEGKETVGFDKREIPDATEYLGRIVIRFVENPFDTQFSYYEKNLNDFSWGPVRVGTISARKIEGTISQSALLFAGQKKALLLIPFNEKTIEISLTDTADGYLSMLPTFFDFVESFRFVESEPSFVNSLSGNIIVNSPRPNTIVSSPVNVSGKARVFENLVNIRLEDSQGKVLFRTNAYTKATEMGQFGDFSIPLYFSPPIPPSTGVLKVYTNSPKDGSEQDMVEIPLKFR